MQNILQEKGQTLVIKLLHASVFDLSSYMLSDVADVIIELSRSHTDVKIRFISLINFSSHYLQHLARNSSFCCISSQLMSKWLEEAIRMMPAQNAGGAPTATPEQLLEFHSTVTRCVYVASNFSRECKYMYINWFMNLSTFFPPHLGQKRRRLSRTLYEILRACTVNAFRCTLTF